MPTCGRLPSSSGASRGHLGHPRAAFERTADRGEVRKTPRSWAFSVEPPIGIEPMTYALREARHAAPGALPAQMAAHTRPECSQRTGCSGLPVHDPVHGLGQPLGNRMLLRWTLMAHD